MNVILLLFNRKIIHEYTSEVTFAIIQNRSSNITNLIITTISLIIWFGCGLILAFWVKKNMKKRSLKGKGMFFLILLTSFIGFIIYIITINGEIEILEKQENFHEFDEIINEEEKAEFYDIIEEINEEEVEDNIERILELRKIKMN